MTFDEIKIEAERRRKMFHWFIDGLYGHHFDLQNRLHIISKHGLSWVHYKQLTPDFVTKHFNIDL